MSDNDHKDQIGKPERFNIYISLEDWGPDVAKDKDGYEIRPDNRTVIGYGELVSSESVNDYREFTIDVDYKITDRKPTHVVIVATSSILGVVGLGNDAMTPDAVGAAALEHLLVTRHMVRSMPRQFGALTPVAALATGVLARTGVETLELIRGAADRLHPSVVIAIDALAARSRHRLCATVQLGDTGLIPGSGVGNHRKAVNARTLGVPVIALGVPTVIDGAALCGGEDAPPSGLFVTPQDIDRRVRELGRLIGYGVTLALQPGLTPEDAAALLG